MMEAYGSQDDIEDALDSLRDADVHYVLIVGVPGEHKTRIITSNPITEDIYDICQSSKELIDKVIDQM